MEYINFLLYACLLFLIYKKVPNAKFAQYTVFLWALSAFIGLYYVKSDNFREGNHELSLFPFIYLFLCFCLLIIGFCKQKETVKEVYYKSEKRLLLFCRFICILSLFPFVEIVYQLIDLFVSGRFILLGANYDLVASGEAVSLVTYSKLSILSIEFLRGFKIVGVVLFFYFLQRKKIDKLLLIGLLILSLLRAFQSISNGNRTEMMWFLIYFIGMWLFFKNTISDNGKKFIKHVFVVGSVIFGSIFVGLTIGRYIIGHGGSNEDATNAVMQYTAEGMFSFNNSMFYEEGNLGGVATILPVMQTLGLTKVTMENRKDYVGSHMKGNPIIFYTIIGDFYNDYGFFWTPIILALICFIILKIKIREKMSLCNLILLSTFMYIIANGLFYYCMKTYYTPIYCNLLFYLFAKQLETKRL